MPSAAPCESMAGMYVPRALSLLFLVTLVISVERSKARYRGRPEIIVKDPSQIKVK